MPKLHHSERRILSRPVPIQWAGWGTDTLRLQRAGWQLAVEYNGYDEQYRLIMRHEEMRMTAMTDQLRLKHAMSMCDYHARRGSAPLDGVNGVPAFQVRHIAPTIDVVRHASIGEDWDNFKLIDAETRMSEQRIESIEDMNIFAMAVGHAEEVIIDQADLSVVDHLKAIKELQSETQKALREKARRKREPDEEKVRGEVVVQMVDYRSAG